MWIKLDDQLGYHPKHLRAGPIASWLWIVSLAHCNKYLTDGFISEAEIAKFGVVTNPKKWAERLVEVGLWHRENGGFRIHDYHAYQPTAAEVRTKREKDLARRHR
jgi:hypothetical protein